MGDWQQYIDQVIHQLDYDTNEWIRENVCSEAALYGTDGSCWAFSPGFPELKQYDFQAEQEDGSMKSVAIDELQCAIKATENVRNPTEVGIRLGNEKYMLTTVQPAGGSDVAQLARRGGGGAAIAKTATGIVIAFFKKDGVMSDNKPQNIADAGDQVGAMATFLKEQGF